MLVRDTLTGYLHDIPQLGEPDYSAYDGLGELGLPFLAPLIGAAASALPGLVGGLFGGKGGGGGGGGAAPVGGGGVVASAPQIIPIPSPPQIIPIPVPIPYPVVRVPYPVVAPGRFGPRADMVPGPYGPVPVPPQMGPSSSARSRRRIRRRR